MSFDPATLFASAKTAYDIAKGINALNTDVERNQAVSKVLEVLLSVQQDALLMQKEHSLLLHEKDDLIKKISEFEDWAETERNHETAFVIPDIRVYIHKGIDDAARQTAHWYCTNCWTDRKKSILHLLNQNAYVVIYFCPKCKNEFRHNISHGPSGPKSVSHGLAM